VTITPHLLLAPRSWKNRAIPVPLPPGLKLGYFTFAIAERCQLSRRMLQSFVLTLKKQERFVCFQCTCLCQCAETLRLFVDIWEHHTHITPELIASPYTSSQHKQAPLRFVCNQSFEHEVLVALPTLSVNVTMALKCTVYIQNLGELDRKYRL